jgi:MFS family permease
MVCDRRSFFHYGLLIVVAAFWIQMVAYGTNITFGIFFKRLVTEFGWSRALTSGAVSFHIILRGLVGILVGRLNDKFGPKLIMTACGLFIGLGYLLMSQVGAVWQVYLFYGVLVGIGMSAHFVPLASTIADWFLERRGLATGIFLSGASFGCMIAAPSSSCLIFHYGWRISYLIMGGIALVQIILAAQLLKRFPRERRKLIRADDEIGGDSVLRKGWTPSLSEAIQTVQFWILFSIVSCFALCHLTVLVHLVPLAIDLGISERSAAYGLSIMTGFGIVGRILLGMAGDKFGNTKVLVICFVVVFFDFIFLGLAKGVWMVYLFAAIFGLVGSVCVVLSSPIVAELFGMTSHGSILGTIMLGYSLGGAAGPLLAGYIFDINKKYELDIVICAALIGMVAILSVLLRPLVARIKYT